MSDANEILGRVRKIRMVQIAGQPARQVGDPMQHGGKKVKIHEIRRTESGVQIIGMDKTVLCEFVDFPMYIEYVIPETLT